MSDDNDEVMEFDSYEPNYDNKCECCGAEVTVTGVRDGKVIHDWDMCGVCVFGTARALDPDWWNSDEG